jgi:hypothetical protein
VIPNRSWTSWIVTSAHLVEEDAAKRRRIAFIFPYAQYLVLWRPCDDGSRTASRLVRFLVGPKIPISSDEYGFGAVAEAVSEINARLVQAPTLRLSKCRCPNESVRRAFAQRHLDGPIATTPGNDANSANSQPDSNDFPGRNGGGIARMANGFNLVN